MYSEATLLLRAAAYKQTKALKAMVKLFDKLTPDQIYALCAKESYVCGKFGQSLLRLVAKDKKNQELIEAIVPKLQQLSPRQICSLICAPEWPSGSNFLKSVA